MLDQLPALHAQHLARTHGDDEQLAIGQPPEPRETVRFVLGDRFRLAVQGHGHDAPGVHVGEPEPALAPAGTFRENDAIEQGAWFSGHDAPPGAGL